MTYEEFLGVGDSVTYLHQHFSRADSKGEDIPVA